MSLSRSTLAQQLLELDDTAPPDYDPESEHVDLKGENDEPEVEVEAGDGREHYVEVGQSALKKQHGLDEIDDPKYIGKKVSRRDILNDDETDEDGGETNSEPSLSDDEVDGGPEENTVEDIDELTNAKPSSPQDAAPLINSSTQQTEQTTKVNPAITSRDADILKGRAVSRQLALYDILLSARIRIQQAVAACNDLPAIKQMASLASQDIGASDLRASLDHFFSTSHRLSEDVSSLRKGLMASNENLFPPPRKRIRLEDQAGDNEWQFTVEEATDHRNELETMFHPYLLATLHKWSQKINAVSPSTLLKAANSRTSFNPRNQIPLKGVTELIEEILRDESGKLRARTKVLRTAKAFDARDVKRDVFDDSDFYHQLLRDMVDNKRGTEALGESFAFAIRQPKVKKKVDTKASKGRKLHYTTHEKLQNFMVPIPVNIWREEQIDELFGSLFGTNLSHEEAADNNQVDGGQLQLDGFRVFG